VGLLLPPDGRLSVKYVYDAVFGPSSTNQQARACGVLSAWVG
jgi:hypothetical protein